MCMFIPRLSALIWFLILAVSSFGQNHEWPTWRFNYNRSACTPEQLAGKLYLQWQVQYSPRIPVWDDPLNQNLMQFDRIFEPVVSNKKMFIGFNDQDKVVALDINDGRELWHFYADGPVRFPLSVYNDKVYLISDDGYCYCLDANSGSLVWKRLLAPAANKLLGNKRLISMWPARGGPVIKDGILYTAASIFPLMGTFIYALDTETGEIIWKNEGTGSNYILQPHRSPAFAYVAPQGNFAISGEKLLVAGGRSVPAAFDLKTGKELYYKLSESGKTGGAFTCCNDKVFFNHHRWRLTCMYDSETGNRLKYETGEYPVIDGDTIYFSGENITAVVLDKEKLFDTLWTVSIPATNDIIKAGSYLYAADSTGINAIRLNKNSKPEQIWRYFSDKPVERLVAACGKLIAVSADGTIKVFGDRQISYNTNLKKQEKITLSNFSGAADIIRNTGITEGFALVLGTNDFSILEGLIFNTSLSIIAYDKDPSRVNYLREYFDSLGVPAGRISFLKYENRHPLLPKYFSSVTIVDDRYYLNNFNKDILCGLYESTRPYGGKIWIHNRNCDQDKLAVIIAQLDLYGAELTKGRDYTIITRTGSLEESAPWTHNYGDIANTVKSEDRQVKAPLGILWFGGNSNLDVLPRHGHGPGEQVVDGYLIIEGINSISARDVYTGRVIWKRESEKLMDDSWLVYYDETYDEDNPLDPKYNQVHLPGANARGTNFIATKEYVYLLEDNKCHLLDLKTGELVRTFSPEDESVEELAYIGVYNDLLILGSNFAEFTGVKGDTMVIKNPKFTKYNLTASRALSVFNRFTGDKLWSITANHGFIHNSVIAGDDILFCLDKLPQYLETKLKRRGEPLPEGSRLLYLDIKTGKIIYEEYNDVFGTWLGYSSRYKLLLQATRPSRDMLHGEEGNRMIAYNAITKEKIWDKALHYANPPIIHNNRIYTDGEGFYLLTGNEITEKDPITGENLKWRYKREYGCGIVAASEYLLTFRSASAGFINLDVFEGTGSLGGWKAGCSTNLIAADGVLNSPDYTRTCQCPYQNQTSLALINMPWMTYWTNSNYKWNGKQIKKLGLNFNAPGDRTSDNNILWLEFPDAGGESSDIQVAIDTCDYFEVRKEPISVASENSPWISASAIGGIRSISITLSKEEEVPDAVYTVKLYFCELQNKKPGERVFNICLQNKKLLDNFDIVNETGTIDKEVVKIFSGIRAGQRITVDLEPVIGNTIISGIELLQEKIALK